MHRLLILGVIAFATAAGLACSDDDSGGGGAGQPREEELRQTVDAAFDAFIEPDVDELYGYFSSGFKERCDERDFRRIMRIAAIFLGDIDAELEINSVEVEGDRGHVEITVTSDEPGFETDVDDDDDFFREWVIEDGEWKAVVEDENPCDLESGFSADDDDDDDDGETGQGVPRDGEDGESGQGVPRAGGSRASAVALGERVKLGDAEISVISVNLDATLPDGGFDPTPEPQRRFVVATVFVSHAGDGDESLSVSASDFKLTGTANVVYDGFADDTSCGFLDGELQGEMFPGGTLDGLVCFQVPEDETDLILIAEPFFAFGEDDDRRFLRLE